MAAAVELQIRSAGVPDRAHAIEVLRSAFFNDPLSVWLVPEPARRRRFHRGIFAAAFDDSVDGGAAMVAVCDGVIAGGALWYPPGRESDPAGTDMASARAALSEEDRQRLVQMRELMGRSHPREPHHYLWLMAVSPRHHNRGVGGALMAGALERCDRLGHGAYLEATSPDNRRLYSRWGFRDRDAIDLPAGPRLFAMWREPNGVT